ncbi:alpha/beta fold hydrolase [Microbacterium sp.]|uniref:alpha/beta fold hydrolase n=1 Tax=Microbacterium sp. TaxID=51671 RepID=UPI0039E43E7B
MSSHRQRSSRKVYVPVLHGIGTTDHSKFATRSVARIAAHLDASSQWHVNECPENCDGYSRGHQHVTHSSRAEAILDPVSWFDLIETPRRRDAVRWLAKTLFVLCCVHLLVNGQAVLDVFSRSGFPGIREGFRHPVSTVRSLMLGVWRVLRAMLWILALGLGSIAVSLPALALVVTCPPALRLVSDALGWTTNDTSREAVLQRVSIQVNRPRVDHVVLIGHSQGGAIAAEVVRRRPKRTTTLITVGSGLAVLAAVRTGRAVSARAVVGIVIAILSYVAVAGFALFQFALEALRLAAFMLLEAVHWGTAVWTAAISPKVSIAHATESMHLSISAAAHVLAFTPDLGWLLVTPVLAIPIVWLYARAIRTSAGRVVKECQIDVSGVDLCATFDPVSFPLASFGGSARVRRITQSSSLTDHSRYFSNRSEVLTEIERHLTGAAVGAVDHRGVMPHDNADAPSRMLSAEATLSSRTARVARASGTLAIALIVSAGWPTLPHAAGLCALAAYVIGTLLKNSTWSRRQRHTTDRSIRRYLRRPRHPIACGLIAAVSAMPMLGSLSFPASSLEAFLAAVAYVASVITVCCALGRATWSAGMLTTSLSLAASVWATQSTGYGAAMSVLHALIAVVAATRQVLRHRAAYRTPVLQ